MVYILLVISFIIHFLLFRIILQLKRKVEANEQQASTSTKEQEDRMEEKLTVFLQEMRRENDRFIRQVQELNTKDVVTPPEQTEETARPKPIQEKLPVEKNKNQGSNQFVNPNNSRLNEEVNQPNDDSFQSLLEKSIASQDMSIQPSKEARVLHLHSQGNTVEEIAKKLDIGKTEVELIVKIQQNQRK